MAQIYQGTKLGDGDTVDYTPSGADVAAGDVIEQGNLLGIATQPIKDGELGSIAIDCHARVVKANEEITVGTLVYWDNDGSPQGGVALSGAATATALTNIFMGLATAYAAATDETVEVRMAPSFSA